MLLSIITSAQHLEAGVSLEYSKYDIVKIGSTSYDNSPVMFTTQLRYKVKNFSLITDTHCYMNFSGKVASYRPSLMIYDVKLQYAYKTKLKVYIKHRCIHPVYTQSQDLKIMTGGYTKVGFSYNIE